MITLIKAAIVALLLAAITAGLYRVHSHIEGKGYVRGIDAQKAIDQPVFDRINTDLAEQKSSAEKLFRELANKVLAETARADAFKNDLEKARAINRNLTNDTARQLAGVRLRFAAESSSPTSASCRSGGTSPGSSQAAPASDTATPSCVLSGAVEAAIKLIVFDADTLRDDYKLLYEWVNRENAP